MHFIADTIAGVKGIFTKAEKTWVKAMDYTASVSTSCGAAFFDVWTGRGAMPLFIHST